MMRGIQTFVIGELYGIQFSERILTVHCFLRLLVFVRKKSKKVKQWILPTDQLAHQLATSGGFNYETVQLSSEDIPGAQLDEPFDKHTECQSFVISLAWPDRFFSHGAYRLKIISACSKKGLVPGGGRT